MKPTRRYLHDMLDMDVPAASGDVVWRAGLPTAVDARDGMAVITVPFFALQAGSTHPVKEQQPMLRELVLRAYGDDILRLSLTFDGTVPSDAGDMLEWHPDITPRPLVVRVVSEGWQVVDARGTVRAVISTAEYPVKIWTPEHHSILPSIALTLYPDGHTAVPLKTYDSFFNGWDDSLPLAYVERAGAPHRVAFSLAAGLDEKFAGTGERFTTMNLSGKTFVLENEDALGVNSRRCYKNIPFYLSSVPYGLLMHTSAHARLSLADISTRAAQGMIEEPVLDLFCFGGGSFERILCNYRRVTGFPRDVPFWSYGAWMSRMTYFTAEETLGIADRLRAGDFPFDVLHLDTGWFERNWFCDWEFNSQAFPDPEGYFRAMRERGFRVTLWQHPAVEKETKVYPTARDHGYLPPKKRATETKTGESSFFAEDQLSNTTECGRFIDFTNPAAVAWYQGLLERLLRMGAVAIKTDFGEMIDFDVDYAGLPNDLLHNRYALLYQRAAYEITERTTGEGIIWARAGWTGCHRYPVHWSGDCACTWDGLAGSIRGGLHAGLSGFAFWSHDIGGFHGVPEFMSSWPAENLYLRWTQFAAFCSHFRYHGTSPREPYEYPGVADLVRQWLRLRYALIPYLREAGHRAIAGGMPVLRALVLHHPDDPTCWAIDDAFYCGEELLVAPVLNDAGVRDVYLPEGAWTDLWTGEVLHGPRWLRGIASPLSRIPIYARTGSTIPVYPEAVRCTDDMDLAKVTPLTFDAAYAGLTSTVLGRYIEL